MDKLCRDMLYYIFNFLTKEDLYYVSLVNKRLSNFIEYNQKIQKHELNWYACKRGYITQLEWLKKYNLLEHYEYSRIFCIENGRLEALIWLHNQGFRQEDNNSSFCVIAAKYGYIHILEWLKTIYPFNEHICTTALMYGRIETLRWLRSQNPPCPWLKEIARIAKRYKIY
jgi:hypothetical protein